MAGITAQKIAEYFLRKTVDEESDDAISNLKLQKLLYYAQGYHLGLFGAPLFDDEIMAWAHGPVVPTVWRNYNQYGSASIPAPDSVDLSEIGEDKIRFLDEIYKVMGQYSPWKLRNMTHDEAPWKNAKHNGVITKDSMRSYFGSLLKK